MRRTALLLSVVGLIATGFGCKHIAGKCDCQQNPADAVMPSPSMPYSAMPITTSGMPATTSPTTSPMPMPMTSPAPR